MSSIRMRTNRQPVTRVPMHVGDKVKFEAEKGRYTVRAVSADGRWVICTKPFNPQRTALYTVIDFDSGVRGPDDHFNLAGYEDQTSIDENLRWFEDGRAEVSVRRDVYLDIERVDLADSCPS